MNSELIDYIAESNSLSDPRAQWDFLKFKIKQFSRKYSIEQAKSRRENRKKLEDKVQRLEKELSVRQNADFLEKYEKAKTELDDLYNYITEGIILRSKCV